MKKFSDIALTAQTCREQDAKTELANLQTEINEIRSTAPQEKFVRLLTEPANHTPPSYLFIRGDHEQPGQQVEPSELTVLQSASPVKIEMNDPQRPTTGRRLAYARHLTNGQHPLLARVLMNRVWLHHFGRGIVETPGDFGFLGAPPTHPELLDWLADELMRGGWNLVLCSAQSCCRRPTSSFRHARRPGGYASTPTTDSTLGCPCVDWNRKRFQDAMLCASGDLLDHMAPPVPVKKTLSANCHWRNARWGQPIGNESDQVGVTRRSVYVQVRRTRPLAVLETFDIATVSLAHSTQLLQCSPAIAAVDE
ncbi:MAG: DUF1553 domain-containing protein [Pirellulaceae bacterium]